VKLCSYAHNVLFCCVELTHKVCTDLSDVPCVSHLVFCISVIRKLLLFFFVRSFIET
jgi:hypothetical protein